MRLDHLLSKEIFGSYRFFDMLAYGEYAAHTEKINLTSKIPEGIEDRDMKKKPNKFL